MSLPHRPIPALEQYLSRYAESECQSLAHLPLTPWRHCLIVPCFAERPDFAKRLEAGPLWQDQLLAIVVINQPPGPPEPNNHALLHYFLETWPLLGRHEHLYLLGHPEQDSRWLIIDRFQEERALPRQQGVGLARKIGCDLATKLYQLGYLSGEWLHLTDADAHLPEGYFELPSARGYSAAVYQFEHILAENEAAPPSPEQVYLATQWYELALRYYILGLAWAGSPYAWPTIGSALAVSVPAYCQARGMPKKAAGEDFYLLNKLSKLGAVYQTKELTVRIDARQSTRVPFGTGPSVQNILTLKQPALDYRYYHPETFVGLKAWLDMIPQLWDHRDRAESVLAALPSPVREGLRALKVERLFTHLQTQIPNAEAGARAAHHWFDAFRTLKLIHFLQKATPDQSLARSIEHASFAAPLRGPLANLVADCSAHPPDKDGRD